MGAWGSPYFEMQDNHNFNTSISEASLQSYFRDVVISTISLNFLQPTPLWTNTEPVSAMEGANVYIFDGTWQFYAPYASCLVVTAVIYALGYHAMWKSDAPVGNGFPRFIAANIHSIQLRQPIERH